jgi:hypothetical protein
MNISASTPVAVAARDGVPKQRLVGGDSDRRRRLNQLVVYFSGSEANFRKMHEALTSTSAPSLRMLEYLCTVKGREGLIVVGQDGRRVVVDTMYKNSMRSLGKRNFDPFRRNSKNLVTLQMHGKKLVTTHGQLAFFKSIILCGIYAYAVENRLQIDDDMRSHKPIERKHPGSRYKADRCTGVCESVRLVFSGSDHNKPQIQLPVAKRSGNGARLKQTTIILAASEGLLKLGVN